jgi:hypothetical protein
MSMDMKRVLKIIMQKNGIDEYADNIQYFLPSENNHNLVAVSKEKKVAIKIYDNSYVETFNSELNGFRVLRNNYFNIPKLIDAGVIEYGKHKFNYILMTMLNGKPLNDIMMEENDTRVIRRIGEDIGKIFKGFYSRHCFSDNYLTEAFKGSNERFERFFTNRLYRQCSDILVNQFSNMDSIWELLYFLDTRFEFGDFTWVTFGLHLKHIYWDNHAISGLIDFEFTKKFDKSIDLAILFHDILYSKLKCKEEFITSICQYLFDSVIERTTIDKLKYLMVRQALIHLKSAINRKIDRDVCIQEYKLLMEYCKTDKIDRIFRGDKSQYGIN